MVADTRASLNCPERIRLLKVNSALYCVVEPWEVWHTDGEVRLGSNSAELLIVALRRVCLR